MREEAAARYPTAFYGQLARARLGLDNVGENEGQIGFHGGKVNIDRPRLRGFDGKEYPVPSRRLPRTGSTFAAVPRA
jgi:hypothetical protein